MAQHFLLSAEARTLSLASIYKSGEEAAYGTFCRMRWTGTEGAPVCPRCGSLRSYDVKGRRKFKCAGCTHQFSVTSGTIFASRKMAFTDLCAAIILCVNAVKGLSALQLGRDIDCQYKCEQASNFGSGAKLMHLGMNPEWLQRRKRFGRGGPDRMSHRTVALKLVPSGLLVDRHEIGTAGITVHAHGASATSLCPTCGLASSSVHSRYGRTLGDFPAHGRRLRIRLAARRFRCRNAVCERQVFTERFSPDLIQAHARRTSRLDVLTHAIALVLGGRPGERLAERLSMPVSADTLLRLLRRRAAPTPSDTRVVGIDDFAWLKGQRYGTIVCDLERRRTIDLLPDREGGTVADWLAAHPEVEIVCRDRGSGYREGATKGAPRALQIADRWHLLENATAAFVEGVKRHMGDLRRAIVGGDVDPDALSAAEKVQWAGWKRRDAVNGTVRNLHGQGCSIKGIVRTTGVSRQTVRRILAGTRDDVFRSRETTLDRWAERLNADWNGGNRNGAELWRRLRDAGYGGSQRVVTEWATRRRRATEASPDRTDAVTTVPPARTIARLLTSERDCKSAEALRVRVAIETASPRIVAARNLLDRFRTMVAAKKTDDLTPWLRDAVDSELASFASGVRDDEAAVRAAIVEPWSNGQTEGQVTKLKLVKRQMYGRGKIDLLRARVVHPG